MAGGAIVNTAGGKEYPGQLTLFVLLTCIVAATGGLIFGYDIGISGGVTSMDSFLKKFFLLLYRKEKEDKFSNQYWKFDSQLFTTFSWSLYLAALIASFFASLATKAFGRKWAMFGGGLTFLICAVISGIAENVLMLILGHIFLGIGVGVGFVNKVGKKTKLETTKSPLETEISGYEIKFTARIESKKNVGGERKGEEGTVVCAAKKKEKKEKRKERERGEREREREEKK